MQKVGGLASRARAHSTRPPPDLTRTSPPTREVGWVPPHWQHPCTQSQEEAESWVRAFLGGLLCSGNPGITPPFQRGRALGLGVREPDLTFQAGLEFTLAQWLREGGLQGPCCSPLAIFKDTAPHTSCPLSVPRAGSAFEAPRDGQTAQGHHLVASLSQASSRGGPGHSSASPTPAMGH